MMKTKKMTIYNDQLCIYLPNNEESFGLEDGYFPRSQGLGSRRNDKLLEKL